MSTVVLCREIGGDETRRLVERQLVGELERDGIALVVSPHLYHVEEMDGLWGRMAELGRPIVFVGWLHERPMRWLLARHGIAGDDVRVFDLTQMQSAAEMARAIGEAVGAGEPDFSGNTQVEEIQKAAIVHANAVDGGVHSTYDRRGRRSHESAEVPGKTGEPVGTPGSERFGVDVGETMGEVDQELGRHRWYPVLDKSRCTDCGHCLQFCLFGVYSKVDGKVVASSPDSCKSGCPACSRICPHSAIMFPLYRRDEAIAGATGMFVQVDDAARKMYQERTGKPYGGEQQESTGAVDASDQQATAQPAFDDLDQLVADLDSFAKDRQR